ncbi:hypothetical protein [Streptomyces sp. NPDC002403]
MATLVHLRHSVTHDVLACWSGGPVGHHPGLRRRPGRPARRHHRPADPGRRRLPRPRGAHPRPGCHPTTKPHASRSPQPESPSNTASPTSRTGEPSPGTTLDETACPAPSEPSPDS